MRKYWLFLTQFITASPLRNRLILFLIILASVPILVLGAVSISLIDLSHRQDVSSLELQLIDQKIEEIEKFFIDTLGILELRVGFTQNSPIELSQQEFLLEGLLQENAAFEEVSFIGLDGMEDSKRTRVAGNVELADVSRLPHFTDTVEGNNYFSDVYATLEGPMLTIAAPVFNRNNDIIQVLSAEVSLSAIVRSIESASLGASGYVLLFDNRGSLVAYGGREEVLGGTDLSGSSRVDRVLRGQVLDALEPEDRYESLFGSLPVVGAGKKIPQIGWVVLAEWPIVDADALILDIRNQVVLLIIFSVIAVILLASFFATRLVRPIRALKRGARAIERGDFSKRVTITTNDELEELGHAFNKMAKGLKRLSELRDEFVFIAAHELRSPVTVIKSYLSMTLEGDAGPISKEAKNFLEKTQKANDRLNRLVSDLLEVARSEAGRIVIETAPLTIEEPTRATLQELKTLAKEKSISLDYTVSKNLPNVLGDSDRIKEILVNLMGNAIKYTQEGGKIRVFHEVRGGNLITHIEDNGFGIAKKDQNKMFQKFYRVQTEQTRDITGTGLGLFIVKQLVEKMRGKIWFISEKGKGSTFSFSLPLA